MSIRVTGVHKRFGAFTALDDINVEFPNGELVALLGPSGCGKTTLLRIIAGLESPDRGSILLSGEDASHKHVRERNVGFVFQHYALFRHMTVFDNVAFGLRMKPRAQRPSKAQIREKVERLLDLVQLGWTAQRYPSQLSGGQRQRIALARALAVEPQVLLLDEPFGALDAKVRKELRRWLRGLHDELKVTSIFVTHDQDEALEVADRVVLMNHGRIEQIGSPEQVWQEPASAFVFGFLGNVNVFHARSDSEVLRWDSGGLAAKRQGTEPGAEYMGFARPHELHIDPDDEQSEGLPARIARIRRTGLGAKIALDGRESVQGQHFEVELDHRNVERLGLQEGQCVRVTPSRLRFFPSASAGGSRA